MSRYPALKGLYAVGQKLGIGGFAKVKQGIHLLSGEKVAIKIMEKSQLGDDLHRVKTELDALKTVSHPNICQLYQIIETDTHYYLILEYCSGGELFDHVVGRKELDEKESRIFFRQIISAIAYLHGEGYAHRDLKPENILLDKDHNLKLIDFGLAAKPIYLDSFLHTPCGTPSYAAPEVIRGQQYLGQQVDIWSLGIILYILLCGVLPFDDQYTDSLFKKILSGRYDEPAWLSSDGKHLIRSMLQVDPSKRILIDDIMCHPWVMKGFSEPVPRKSLYTMHEKNAVCLNVMAREFGVSEEDIWLKVKSRNYDYTTATYMLLLSKKRRGLPIKLDRGGSRAKQRNAILGGELTTPNKHVKVPTSKITESPSAVCKEGILRKHSFLMLDDGKTTPVSVKKSKGLPVKSERDPLKAKQSNAIIKDELSTPNKQYNDAPILNNSYSPFPTPKFKNTYLMLDGEQTPVFSSNGSSAEQNDVKREATYLILHSKESTPNREFNSRLHFSESMNTENILQEHENDSAACRSQSVRKPHKRLWSPGPDDIVSPIPSKLKIGRPVEDLIGRLNSSRSLQPSGKPRSSAGGTPSASASVGTATPASAGRGDSVRRAGVLGSLGRRLHRVRRILTPGRCSALGAGGLPATEELRPTLLPAKNICNVSTTSSNNPEKIMQELRNALLKRGVCVKQKGFKLRGKLASAPSAVSPSADPALDACSLSFELEVCLVAAPDSSAAPVVGIRRKRLKGDAWWYKRVVEEVLAMASV